MCRISSLEEAKIGIMETQMNSAGSEFELLLSQTAHQTTALGRLNAQPVSSTYDKLIIWPTVATSWML